MALDDQVPQPLIGRDSIAAQRERLLAGLRKHDDGATRAELEHLCDVPSVTKRVCELIAEGWPIERMRCHVDSPHGLRRATFYRLTGPCRQRELFDA